MARLVQHLSALLGIAVAAFPGPAQSAEAGQSANQQSVAIVPETELEDALPELDPALDAPLETIEEFEARLTSEAFPAPDPELSSELPSLANFKAELEAAPELPQGADEAGQRYQLVVRGLEQASKEAGRDLGGLFKQLSALQERSGKPATLAQITTRLSDDIDLMRRILVSEGWFEARITPRLVRASETDADGASIVLEASPGTRFRLGSITLDAQGNPLADPVRSSLNLAVGEPIVSATVLAAEQNLANAMAQNGYAFAEIGERDILLDSAAGSGEYKLIVRPGPLSRFGTIRTDGTLAFGADHVSALARFRPGELYDARKVDDLRNALVATGLFASVSAAPEHPPASALTPAAPDSSESIVLHVAQVAGPPRTIAASLGFATGEGLHAAGSWTHRNLFPPEGALIASATAGTKEQSIKGSFRRANAGRRDRSFEVVAELLHRDFAAYQAYSGKLAAGVNYESTPIWQKVLTYGYGGELLVSIEKDFNPAAGERDQRRFMIGNVGGQIGYDRTNSLLDPTRGYRIGAALDLEGSVHNGFEPYTRLRIDGSAYRPLAAGTILAARVRFASIAGIRLAELAPSRRIYGGGGGSVRGIAFQRLGPQDANGDPTGGRSLSEASAEVRYRWGDFGVVGFADVGQVYASTRPKFSDLRMGLGVGGRYYTDFGPFRLDVAIPIDRRPGENRFSFYISVGQAF